MSLSQISVQQRQRETKTCLSLLACAIPSSLILHIAILTFGVNLPWSNVQKLPEKPIEVVMVEPKPPPLPPKPLEKQEPQKIAKIVPKPETKQATRGGDGKRPSPKNIAPTPKPAVKIQQPKPLVKNNPVAKLSTPTPPKPIIKKEPVAPLPTPPQPKPTPEKAPIPEPEARPLPPLARELVPLPPIRRPNPLSTESPQTNNFSPQPNNSNNSEVKDSFGDRNLARGSSSNFSGSETETTDNGNGNTGGDGSGGKVSCLECSKPDYPAQAREQELEGKVKVAVDIDPEGNVTDAKIAISSGHIELDEAALEKAKEWKFTTSKLGKKGMVIVINFKLEEIS
jgi:TonB family protein